MVWNINFQIAGLILTVVCGNVIFTQKRLEFRAEKAYARMLSAVIAATIFDILSIVAINYRNEMPAFLVEVICETYLFMITLVAMLASRYCVAEIRYDFNKWLDRSAFIPLIIEVIACISFKTNIVVEVLGNEVYTAGIPVVITYINGAVYIFTTLVMAAVFNKHIPYYKKRVIYFSMLTWILAAVIQGINNSFLIATYAMSIVCVYIYCKLENPEHHLEVSLDVFNRHGFDAVVDEYKRLNKRKGVMGLSITNLTSVSEIFGGKTIEKLKIEICKYLKQIEGASIFRIDDGFYIIILERDFLIEDVVSSVAKRFDRPWEVDDTQIAIEAVLAFKHEVLEYKDSKEIIELFRYYLRQAGKRNAEYIKIDEAELERRNRALYVQNALDWAMANDGVEMYYQPIYSIEKGCFESMEALVRIRDEAGNIIMPGEFVEYAEQNGMILKLGEIIFRKICEFIQRNHVDLYGIEYVEVNLSVVQCMQDDLAETFMNIMGEYQIAPHRINLEITETAAINTQETLEKNMGALLKYGTSFSLDDYGSGYSNLTYIVGMPLKIIKIDRSLAVAYDKSEKAKLVVESTIEMVHKLGLEIVVEGIETEEQYQNFKRLGVEFIQGYYFSKPLSSENVLDFVQKWM